VARAMRGLRGTMSLGMARVVRHGVTLGTFATVLGSMPTANGEPVGGSHPDRYDFPQHIFGITIMCIVAILSTTCWNHTRVRLPLGLKRALALTVGLVMTQSLHHTIQAWHHLRRTGWAGWLFVSLATVLVSTYLIQGAVASVQLAKAKRS